MIDQLFYPWSIDRSKKCFFKQKNVFWKKTFFNEKLLKTNFRLFLLVKINFSVMIDWSIIKMINHFATDWSFPHLWTSHMIITLSCLKLSQTRCKMTRKLGCLVWRHEQCNSRFPNRNSIGSYQCFHLIFVTIFIKTYPTLKRHNFTIFLNKHLVHVLKDSTDVAD